MGLFTSHPEQLRGSLTGSAAFELGVLNWVEQEGKGTLGIVLFIKDKEARETE